MRSFLPILSLAAALLLNGCFHHDSNDRDSKPEPVEEEEPSSCADIKCGSNSYCESDFIGGGCSGNVQFSCLCNDGFERTDSTIDKFGTNHETCVDIDECANGNICGEGSRCTNTPGSYYCEEINECIENYGVCGSLDCINLESYYKCECPSHNIFKFNNFSTADVFIKEVSVDDHHYTLYFSNHEIYDYSIDSSDPETLPDQPVLTGTAYFDKGNVIGMTSNGNYLFMICTDGVYVIDREPDSKLNVREEVFFPMDNTSAWTEDSGILVMAGYDAESGGNALFFLDLTAGDVPSNSYTLKLNNTDTVDVLGYRHNSRIMVGYYDSSTGSLDIKSMSGKSPAEFSLKSEIEIEPLDDDGWGGNEYENLSIEITDDKAFVNREGYMDILQLSDDGNMRHASFMNSSMLSSWIIENSYLIQFNLGNEAMYWDITDPYNPMNFLTIDLNFDASWTLKNNHIFYMVEKNKIDGISTHIFNDLEKEPLYSIFTENYITDYSADATAFSSGLTEIQMCSGFLKTYYSNPVILENNSSLYIHDKNSIDIYSCDLEGSLIVENNAFTISEKFAEEKNRTVMKSPDGIVVIYGGTGFGYYYGDETYMQTEGMLADGVAVGKGIVRSDSSVISSAILGNRLYMVDSNDILTFGEIDNFDKTAVSIDIGSDVFAPAEKGIYVKKDNNIYYYDTTSDVEPLKLGIILNLERIFATNDYLVTQSSSSISVWVLSPEGSLVLVEDSISLSEIILEAHEEDGSIYFSTDSGYVYQLVLPDCI
ncbi:MAG TPA: calcium-binding EGF-like domain-containing protein [bacterium]|nr:calcium-binding EGF-like domain-containing protein [bacterium]